MPGFGAIIIYMSATETVQFRTSAEFRQQLESEAARLNLSLSAYIMYLHLRRIPGRETALFDREIQEIFGKHGELMRRLAK